MPASPAPPVPDWSIELEAGELEAVPLAPGLADPLGPLLVGAEVVPPRSDALPGRELCSHAPNARAPATARIPIMSLRFIAFSRGAVAPSVVPPGALCRGDDAGRSTEEV